MPLELCEDCGWMHWTTDRCKEPKKSSGGSSEVEHRPSKSGVEGSIPSRRSKKTASGLPRAKGDISLAASTVRKNMPVANGVSVAERVEPRDSALSAKRPVDTNSEPLTLPVGEEQPRTSQPQGTRNEGVPTIPKPKHIDRHKPGYMSTYMRDYRARKAKLKAEREEK